MAISFPSEMAEAVTVTMLKEAFKYDAMGRTQVYKWFDCFKEVKRLLKINPIVAALPQAEMMKLLKKFAKLSLQNVVRSLTKFLK